MEREGKFIQGFFLGSVLSLMLWFSFFGWMQIIFE